MEHRFQPTHYYNTLGAHPPVLRVADGDTIVTTTIDAMGYDAQGMKVADGPNPQSGPFFVEGAMPGDALAVHFDSMYPNREHGWSGTVMQPNVVDPAYARQLPERMTSDWLIDRTRGTATLVEPAHTNLGCWTLPVVPMLGCFGVAAKGGQALSAATSAEHGGNMDYRGFTTGVTAYLPVFVEGALFFLGDGHALQADGEILGSGIDISMDVRVTLRVRKGWTINWPRGENGDYIFTVGNARPLDQALQHATTEMLRWLQTDYGLDARGANILLGHTVVYEIGNVIDPAYTVVCKVPKRVLPRLSQKEER